MLKPVFVESSNIECLGYQYGAMFIRFVNGMAYEYKGVPFSVFQNMCNAESVGKYFHANVRGIYDYAKLAFDPFGGLK